jgi:hypothetical protein
MPLPPCTRRVDEYRQHIVSAIVTAQYIRAVYDATNPFEVF